MMWADANDELVDNFEFWTVVIEHDTSEVHQLQLRQTLTERSVDKE